MSVADTIRENAGLKALSFLLAGVLWFTLAYRQEAEMKVTVPVVLRNVPPQLAVAVSPPRSIEVEISGPKIVLVTLDKKRLVATLDLGGATLGTVAFTNLDRTVHLGRGLRVMRVQPATIELKLVKNDLTHQAHPAP